MDLSLKRSNGSDPDAMTISQLAERTGVPTRRIRYYVSEGLLPKPVGRGRASHYTRGHMERLQEIIALRDVNLGLDEIRERLGEAGEVVPRANRPERHSEPWQRWEVVPGVEIHARGDLDEQTLATVQVMVGAVRHVLESGEFPSDQLSGRGE